MLFLSVQFHLICVSWEANETLLALLAFSPFFIGKVPERNFCLFGNFQSILGPNFFSFLLSYPHLCVSWEAYETLLALLVCSSPFSLPSDKPKSLNHFDLSCSFLGLEDFEQRIHLAWPQSRAFFYQSDSMALGEALKKHCYMSSGWVGFRFRYKMRQQLYQVQKSTYD